MSDKIKDIVVTIIFVVLLLVIFVSNMLKQDNEISISERRKLAKFPEITSKKLLDGSFFKEFEKYTTDQIIKREDFRKLKAITEFDVFFKNDNNNLYMKDNSIIKIEYPLNEKSILNATKKINQISEKYLKNNNVYYSIVPDKNYFSNEEQYIKMDYEKIENIMKENIINADYINIFDTLSLEDYYITDIHWKQENIIKVLGKISTEMKFKERITTAYNKKYITDFEGIYSGQLPIKTKKDSINILTNSIIDSAIVYNYETKEESSIYNLEKINSYDKYDIYLSGATPLLEIRNSNAKTDKELIVFRDSFASSLVPLFTEGYKKITLVDIRYIRSSDLSQYIEFDTQDVLFIYSTTVLNNSFIFK